jgi:hypothetical protein
MENEAEQLKALALALRLRNGARPYSCEVSRQMTAIEFQYDLDEIVQMDGIGPVSLRTALKRMPDRIGPLGVLYRDQGKVPALFDAAQIQSLLDRHRAELEAGNPPGHREADEHDE